MPAAVKRCQLIGWFSKVARQKVNRKAAVPVQKPT